MVTVKHNFLENIMRITKIEIQNYKSINNLVDINFYNDLPTVLIGKNGSGKSNILEALSIISESNGNYFAKQNDSSLKYCVHLVLEKNEAKKLFPNKNINEKKCKFIAYANDNKKICKIKSEYLVPFFKEEINEFVNLANELKDALNTYENLLNKIGYEESNEQQLRGFEIKGFKNATTNYDSIKFKFEFVLQQANELAQTIKQNFCVSDDSFEFAYIPDYYQFDNIENLSFRLDYVKPDLAPFEEKYITIDEAAIKREITKINKETKSSYDKLNFSLNELTQRAKRLKAALSDDQFQSENSGEFYNFIREVQKCIGAKCTFLQNENTELIFKKDNQIPLYYNNESETILQTYINKVYEGKNKDELQEQINKSNDFLLPEAALKKFEKYLNEHKPEFENGMYERIEVKPSDGKAPIILLHEKNGKTVALNSTSAGRRWYFTYYFMKNTLKIGDLFIIDEPACMLHPQAQKEILKELIELQKQGIKVVYSTHSPYLIPDKWESVHFVTMTDNGTAVTQENKYNHFKEVIGEDIFDLQEVIDKYRKSDRQTVANKCYRTLFDTYGSVEKAANELAISESTIVSWRKDTHSKKSRCPKLENIILIAQKTGHNIADLL